jgi:hypothetical protein
MTALELMGFRPMFRFAPGGEETTRSSRCQAATLDPAQRQNSSRDAAGQDQPEGGHAKNPRPLSQLEEQAEQRPQERLEV